MAESVFSRERDVMNALSADEPRSVRELGRNTGMDLTTLNSVLGRLHRDGRVSRTRGASGKGTPFLWSRTPKP